MTFSGLYVPMITPFDATGAVARDALAALAHEMLDGGATGLVALGTTAEPGSLTDAERQTVVDTLAGVCHERSAALLVGADRADTVRALRARPEVTAALSLVPPFVRPGEEGVVAHFRTLTAAGMPIMVYHVPYRTGQDLSAAAIRRLAALPGIAGIKYATGAVDATAVSLLADPPTGFAILSGDDTVVSPMLALGAHGGILASAHVAPAAFAELIAAWRAGEAGRARALGHRLGALAAALFAEPNPAVVKAVLHAQGRIPTAAVRLPLLPAGPDSLRAAVGLLPADSLAAHV